MTVRDTSFNAAPRSVSNSSAAIEQFLAAARKRSVPPRTLLIASSTPHRLGYVLAGSLEVMIEDDEGREIVLARLGSGEFFGEMGFFDPQGTRNAWVRARSRAEVAEMSYERFARLAEHDPGLTHALAAQLAKRLARTNRQVRELAFVNVAGRIAHIVRELCAQPEALPHPHGVQIRISRSDLGRMAGCSREMAGRVIKDFNARGLLRALGKTLVIADAKRLSADAAADSRLRRAPR